MTGQLTAYLAGPMRHYPQFNFPAFLSAAADLDARGLRVVSPAQHDLDGGFDPSTMTGQEDLAASGFDLKAALAWDLQQVLSADLVVLLDGWEQSAGAQAEVRTAQAAGIPVYPLQQVLDAAAMPAWERDLLASDEDPQGFGPQIPDVLRPVTAAGEVRVTSATGGAKGKKGAQFSLLPADAMWELAEHYGFGAGKYEAVNGLDNWRNGYPWSLSFDAAFRHLHLALAGQDVDGETGSKHVIAVAWHMLYLAHMMNRPRMRELYDDRQDPRCIDPGLPFLQATSAV